MTEGRRFKQVDPLDHSLLKEAERRWREARRVLVERDTLASEVRLAEAAASNKKVAMSKRIDQSRPE